MCPSNWHLPRPLTGILPSPSLPIGRVLPRFSGNRMAIDKRSDHSAQQSTRRHQQRAHSKRQGVLDAPRLTPCLGRLPADLIQVRADASEFIPLQESGVIPKI